jgi:Fe-S-cluster containining protein
MAAMVVMSALKDNVVEAALRPEVRREVLRLYAELQAEIDSRRPICQVSGRCCRFEEFGHRLYVTTAELATFTAELAETTPAGGSPVAGGCPFQTGKICRVHTIRPMGCRVFFCDASATDWQQALYEQFHARLKKLHEDLSIPYGYMEWRFACNALGLELPK